MTISDIKDLVGDRTGRPCFDQRLMACGKKLKDGICYLVQLILFKC
jgi:hypothetical protein